MIEAQIFSSLASGSIIRLVRFAMTLVVCDSFFAAWYERCSIHILCIFLLQTWDQLFLQGALVSFREVVFKGHNLGWSLFLGLSIGQNLLWGRCVCVCVCGICATKTNLMNLY